MGGSWSVVKYMAQGGQALRWCVGMLHLAHWDRGKLRPAFIDISPTAPQACLRHPAPVLPCKVLQISIYLVLAGRHDPAAPCIARPPRNLSGTNLAHALRGKGPHGTPLATLLLRTQCRRRRRRTWVRVHGLLPALPPRTTPLRPTLFLVLLHEPLAQVKRHGSADVH